MKRFVIAALALLAGGDLLAQPAVFVYGDGRLHAHSGERPPEPGELQGLDHAWVWSERSAPRRIDAADFGKEPPPEDRGRLKVRIASTSASQRLPPGLRLLAAPAEMWGQVPEHLLPAWPVPEQGRLAIPRDSRRPWRLRLLGGEHGSWWSDVAAGRPAATLVPIAAGDRVLGIVGTDREALPGAALTLLSKAGNNAGVLAQYRCDEGGEIRVRSLPDAAEVTLIATEARHAPAALSARPSCWPQRLRLLPGGTVRGRFVDPEGVPVPDVEVRADAWLSDRTTATASRRSTSDESGRWSLATLPHGTVGLAATAPGFAPFQTRIEIAGEPVDLGSIELMPGGLLPVLVVDDAGSPVPGATLEVKPGLRVSADSRGKARLVDVPADRTFEVAARADGHLSAEKTITPPLPEALRLTLQRAFLVEGRFVDQEGIAVASGNVRIEVGHRYRDDALGAGGRFALDLEPAREARLVLSSAATRELAVSVEPGAGGETRDLGDLRAPPGVRLRGRLLRADDASPVAGARIWVPRPSPQGDVVAWAQRDLIATTSRTDGSFELNGLPRVPMLLRVEAAGLGRIHLSIEPDAWQVDLGEKYMSQGARVRVLIDEEAEGAQARVDLRNAWLELDMLTATVTEDGQAVVPYVPAGSATVTVLHGRELLCEERIEVAEGEDAIDVDCQAAEMLVSGMVTAGGEPAGPGQLHWQPADTAQVPALIMARQTALGVRQDQTFGAGRPQVDVEVDAGGAFRTNRLRPGKWAVTWLPAAGSMTAPETVELPAAATHDVQLAFGGMSLSGVVIGEDDSPVTGARVRVMETGDAAFTFSRSDGSFSLVGLEPGRHQVHARFGELNSQVVEALIEPGREPEPVVLVLAENALEKVEILVLAGDERPASAAFVFLERDDGRVRMVTTDLDGRAAVELRPPAPRGLRLAGVSDGRWALGSWLSLETASDGVTLTLKDTGAIRIASREQQGAATIFSADGWDVSWLLTRIGARPWLSPDLPLVIRGIPEGRYTLALGDFSSEIAVRHGDVTDVEVP